MENRIKMASGPADVVSASENGIVAYHVGTNEVLEYKYDHSVVNTKKNYQRRHDVSLARNRYQGYSCLYLNWYQQKLYREAVYGLLTHPVEVLMKMPLPEKLRIRDRNRRAQNILNRWKQEIVNNVLDDFLKNGIPGYQKIQAKINSYLKVGDSSTRSKEVYSLSFRDLNLDKAKIAQKLVEEGILPDNFFNLRAA